MTAARGRTLALAAALLGWMFDGMEMGLFPLVGKDALRELLGGSPGQAELDLWYAVVLAAFLIGAATGGVVFGWLGDKIGRVRAMTASVLLYSLCSGLSAASGTPEQLTVLRFLGALGMGGEWALGVALVMELWPNTSRAALAGWIGAFGNLGYTVCGLIAFGLTRLGSTDLGGALQSAGLSEGVADALTANRNWRLLMLVGAVPALLTLFIRLFVPESEKWEREKAAGRASHWSGVDLLAVLGGAAAASAVVFLWARKDVPLPLQLAGTLVGVVLVTLGYLHPARGGTYVAAALTRPPGAKRWGGCSFRPGSSGVPLLATWSGVMWMYQWVGKLPFGDVSERDL